MAHICRRSSLYRMLILLLVTRVPVIAPILAHSCQSSTITRRDRKPCRGLYFNQTSLDCADTGLDTRTKKYSGLHFQRRVSNIASTAERLFFFLFFYFELISTQLRDYWIISQVAAKCRIFRNDSVKPECDSYETSPAEIKQEMSFCRKQEN